MSRILAQLVQITGFLRKPRGIHLSALLLLSALAVLLWFKQGLAIAYAEPGLFMYNDRGLFYMFSHSWVDQASTGTPGLTLSTSALPLYGFLAALEAAGFSPVQREMILFYLILSLACLSMYYLILAAFSENPKKEFIALFAAIFYVLNPYAMVYVWNRFTITMNIAYAILPLILGIYIRGLGLKKYSYAFYLAFVLLSFSPWIGIVPVLVPFLLLTYLVPHIVVHRRRSETIYALRFSALVVLLGVLLNSWALFVLSYNVTSVWSGVSTPNYAKQISGGFPLQDVLRLNFYFGSNAVIWPFYESILGQVLGYLIPSIVFGALVAGGSVVFAFKKHEGGLTVSIVLNSRDRRTSYFAFLAILGIFLGWFASTPLRDVYAAAVDRLPLSPAISNNLVGEKAIALSAIGYSALFGLTLSFIHARMTNLNRPVSARGKRLVAAVLVGSLVFATCGAYVWPMWTGDVFTYPDVPAAEKRTYVEVPGYYYDAATWLSSQTDDFRILSLPFVTGGVTYSWEPYGYSGAATDFQWFPKPVIMESSGEMSNDLIKAIPQLMQSGYTNDVWKVLDLLNVKYIMVHEDINHTVRYITEDPKDIEQQLNSTIRPYVNVQNITDPGGSPLTSSLQGWQPIWGAPPAQLDVVPQADGSAYVEYKANTLENNGYFSVGYVNNGTFDISNATWLHMSLMSSMAGSLYIGINDVDGNAMLFDGRASTSYTIAPNEANGWVNLTLPLAFPSYTTATKPNLSRIVYILIGLVDLPRNVPAELRIMRILLDKGADVPIQGIHSERRFGKLLFYKVDGSLGRVYASNYPIIVNSTSGLIDIVKSRPNVSSDEVFVNGNVGNIPILRNMNDEAARLPNLTLDKISPTQWTIQVQNATNPFVLVFNEAYNPYWKAYYGDLSWPAAFFSPPISDEYHYEGNGYANAWYVDKIGSYTITLYFWPQSLLSLGATISGITTAVAAVVIARRPLKSSLSRLRVLIDQFRSRVN